LFYDFKRTVKLLNNIYCEIEEEKNDGKSVWLVAGLPTCCKEFYKKKNNINIYLNRNIFIV